MLKLLKDYVASVAFMALLLLMPFGVGAEEIGVSGEVDYSIGFSLSENELTYNGVNYELELERELGLDGGIYLSWDGSLSYQPKFASLVVLDEAYVDVYFDEVDLRVGRQVINWGTADGFNPTNVVNPSGELTLSMEELSGIPVAAVQATYYLPSGGSVTAIGITDFVPSAGASETLEEMAAQIGTSLGIGSFPANAARVPGTDGSEPEFALRGETLVGNFNVYASYFKGWDDNPIAWMEYVSSPMGMVPSGIASKYRKVQKLGLATAGSLLGFGVWTEASYTVPDRLAVLDSPGALSSNDPYLELVVGGDYAFPNSITASAQLVYNGRGSLLTPYCQTGVDPQTYLFGMAQYAPFQRRQSAEAAALVNLEDIGLLMMARYTYDLNEVTSVSLGVTKVLGDRNSEFGQIKERVDRLSTGILVRF